MWVLNPIQQVSLQCEKKHGRTGRCHVKVKGEIEVCRCKPRNAKDCGEPPEKQAGLSPRGVRGNGALPTL